MKKIIFSLLLILFYVFAFGQNYQPVFRAGLGVSILHIDAGSASNICLNGAITIKNLYIDISSNFAQGTGEELNFKSSYTKKSDKLNIGCINGGYIIRIKNYEIIPILGYGSSKEIFEDPVGWNTYFYGKPQGYFNFGCIGTIIFSEHITLYVGIGYFDLCKFGLLVGL